MLVVQSRLSRFALSKQERNNWELRGYFVIILYVLHTNDVFFTGWHYLLTLGGISNGYSQKKKKKQKGFQTNIWSNIGKQKKKKRNNKQDKLKRKKHEFWQKFCKNSKNFWFTTVKIIICVGLCGGPCTRIILFDSVL